MRYVADHSGSGGPDLREATCKVRALGHGSFGSVWLAFHGPTQRVVAVKEVSVDAREAQARGLEVALNASQAAGLRAAGAADHVLRFYGSYVDDAADAVGLVLEYMDGGSLDQFAGAPARARLRRRPANVLLSFAGAVKIGDLGLAVREAPRKTSVDGLETPSSRTPSSSSAASRLFRRPSSSDDYGGGSASSWARRARSPTSPERAPWRLRAEERRLRAGVTLFAVRRARCPGRPTRTSSPTAPPSPRSRRRRCPLATRATSSRR
ncbi:MAP kinase kinase [Aureococcus anophagefferens]|nr:MAP kinase kinase [Aureococcus anophagefferens]